MKVRSVLQSWIDAPPHWLRRFGNYAAQVVSVLLLAIPRPVGYWVADRFGDYFYQRNKNLRANVADNMRHVMGMDASPDRRTGRGAAGISDAGAQWL